MRLDNKKRLSQNRIWRVRKKAKGTAERPRLAVRFTEKHIYAQCIDDVAGKTTVSLSTLSKDLKEKSLKANIASAEELGKLFGEKAKSAGVEKVVFDRRSRLYHGMVKAFADAVRSTGIQF